MVFTLPGMVVFKEMRRSIYERFYLREGRFNNVTAMAYYPKEPYVVLGESSVVDQPACLSLLHLSTERINVIHTKRKGIIRQITTGPDGREVGWLLLTTGSLLLGVFNTEKNTLVVICTVKHSVQKISLEQAKDRPNSVYLQSQGSFRSWRVINADQIKESHQGPLPLAVQKRHKFLDHNWKEDSIFILGLNIDSKRRVVFVVERDGAVLQVDVEAELEGKDVLQISEYSVICPLKDLGFILGGRGLVSFFYIKRRKTAINSQNLTVANKDRVASIAVSENEELVTFTTSDQARTFMEHYFLNNNETSNFEGVEISPLFARGHHIKRVGGLALAKSKPVLASYSQDGTVRLWNYHMIDRLEQRCLLQFKSVQQVMSVGIHPSGDFVGLALRVGYKVYAVSLEELILIKELSLVHCTTFSYSNEGHYFVVNQKETYLFYDSINFKLYVSFTFPSSILRIALSADDNYLVAEGELGEIFQVQVEFTGNKYLLSTENNCHIQKGGYNSFVFDNWQVAPDTELYQKQFVGCTSSKYLVIYSNNCKDLVVEFPVQDCVIKYLLLLKHRGLLLAYTSTLRVRAYSFPFVESLFELDFVEPKLARYKEPSSLLDLFCGNSQVRAWTANYDGSWIFMGKNDGSIVSYRLRRPGEEHFGDLELANQDRRRLNQFLGSTYYVRISAVDEKNGQIAKYKEELKLAEQKFRLQKQRISKSYRMEVQALQKEADEDIRDMRQNHTLVIRQIEREIYHFTQTTARRKEDFAARIKALKTTFGTSLEYENKWDEELREQLKEFQTDYRRLAQITSSKVRQQTKNQTKEQHQLRRKLYIQYTNKAEEDSAKAKNYIALLETLEERQFEEMEKEVGAQMELVRDKQGQIEKLHKQAQQLQNKHRVIRGSNEEIKVEVEGLLAQENKLRMTEVVQDCDLMKMKHLLLEWEKSVANKSQAYSGVCEEHEVLQNLKDKVRERMKHVSKQNQHSQQQIALEFKKDEGMVLQLKGTLSELSGTVNESEYLSQRKSAIMKENTFLAKEADAIDQRIQDAVARLQQLKTNQAAPGVIAQFARAFLEDRLLFDSKSQEDELEVSTYQQIERQSEWLRSKVSAIKELTQVTRQAKQERTNQIFIDNVKLLSECKQLREKRKSLLSLISSLEMSLQGLNRMKLNRELYKPKQRARPAGKSPETAALSRLEQLAALNERSIEAQRKKITEMVVGLEDKP